MMTDVPAWPDRLTREQQQMAKQREQAFGAALKADARAAGWRFARSTLFRQADGWFIDVLPSLAWKYGAVVRMGVKPMTLDPVFWDIVGLPENRALPLSFRATGAWVLRPVTLDEPVAADRSEPEAIAAAVLAWSTERSASVCAGASIASMLAALPPEAELRGQRRALAVCLRLLGDDLDGAMQLCRVVEADVHPLLRESGGFTTGDATFLDQARDWIAQQRRAALAVV